MHRIINDREMRDTIILIFANKQDLPDCKFLRVHVHVLSLKSFWEILYLPSLGSGSRRL